MTTTSKAPKFLEDGLKGVTLPFDWRALLLKIGLQALLTLLAEFGVNLPIPVPKQAPKAGCCDHHACCCEVMASAWQTYLKAADHCLQCCDEVC